MALGLLGALLLFAGCGSPGASQTPLGEGEVSFPATDGVALRGRLAGSGDVAVVLAHMYPSDQEEWRPFAQTLAENGYTVLTFNFRGYTPSGGKRDVARSDADLEGAVQYLEGRGAKGVFLVGASMGGTAAVKVAARHVVLGVVAISAPTQFQGFSAVEDAGRVRAPVLYMAAEGDREAQASASALFKAAQGQRMLEVFTGSEHGTALVYGDHASQVRERILEFLEVYSP